VTDEAEPAEERLAMAAQGGDRLAFGHLVTLHKGPLYRLLRRYVGDADDAYDLLQDTFISAWLALKRYDPNQPFAPWLRAIALNKCRDYGRRRAVLRRVLGLFASESASSRAVEADSDPDSERRLAHLDQAIAALPSFYKEPLLLTLVSGLTQQQTALELKTTSKAIEMRIRRAKRRLRETLGEADSSDLEREG
jgi:RNA polymerase sigma-70 factor (ECF subfamily)